MPYEPRSPNRNPIRPPPPATATSDSQRRPLPSVAPTLSREEHEWLEELLRGVKSSTDALRNELDDRRAEDFVWRAKLLERVDRVEDDTRELKSATLQFRSQDLSIRDLTQTVGRLTASISELTQTDALTKRDLESVKNQIADMAAERTLKTVAVEQAKTVQASEASAVVASNETANKVGRKWASLGVLFYVIALALEHCGPVILKLSKDANTAQETPKVAPK